METGNPAPNEPAPSSLGSALTTKQAGRSRGGGPRRDLCYGCHAVRIVRGYCEDCKASQRPVFAARARARRARDPKKYDTQASRLHSIAYAAGRERFRYARKSARARGLEWALSESTWRALIEKPCSYCGEALAVSKCGIGLDRLDNDRGYEPGNVAPCCIRCNRARNTFFTTAEMEAFIGPAFRKVVERRAGCTRPL